MRDKVNGHNGHNGHNRTKTHPDRNLIVSYVTGSSPPDLRKDIEEHCLDCLDCRTQLSILLHLVISSADREEHRKFTDLLALGKEAASRARSIVMMQQRQRPRYRGNFSGTSPGKRLRIPRTVLAPALIIIALFTASLIGYIVSSRQSSEERMLARVRDVYGNSRLLQARVTGGFAHQNYVVTRGSGDLTGVDETQRIALLAEINQEVHTRPKAATRHILGKLLMLQGDLDPAEQQFLLALKDVPRHAQTNADLGALYFERSRKNGHADREVLERAAEYSSNAVEIDPKLTESWFNRALCYEELNLFLQAESDWKQFLTLDGNSAWADEARAHLEKLRKRAVRLEKLEQTVQAEFQSAEAAGDESKMRELVSQHSALIQNLAMDQIFDKYLNATIAGEKELAAQYLKPLKRIGKLVGEIKGDRFVIDAVNFAARANPRVKKEIQAIRQTLQQARQEHAAGKTSAASELCTKARSAAERIGDYCHAEMAALGLVRYYHHKDESQEINSLRNQLVKDTEQRHHRQMHARALHALANAVSAAQQFSLGLKHSQQVVEISRDLGDATWAIAGLRFVGQAYSSLGDNESAARKFSEASSLLRNSGVKPITAALAYSDMGDTLYIIGKYQAAIQYQREAVRMCEQSGNAMLLSIMTHRLGLTYGMLGRYEEAMHHLNDAVARAEGIPDQAARVQAQIDIYTSFGEFYLQRNKTSEAIATYQRAIEKIGRGNKYYLSTIHKGLATAYLAQGKDSEAEAELEKSIKLTEDAREQIDDARSRGTFLASQQSIYRAMVNFQFFNRKDPAQAFNYAEIAKARDLLDTLAGSPEVSTNDGQVKLAVSRSATPLTLEQVQKALPVNTQLVQYVIGENNLMIWLVTRDRLITANARVNANDLGSKVTAYLDELRKRGEIEGLNSRAADLYQWLIAPISRQLDPNMELCIVPDGLLQNLPFAALVSPETKRYLIEDFSLTTNPSASVFARTLEISCEKQSSGSGSFLGLANPRFNQQRFPKLHPLPSSDEELERIQSFYSDRRILSRGQATESDLINQIGKYEVVHLATHALSDKRSSLFSAIVLADEGDRPAGEAGEQNPGKVAFDGALRAHEIYRLKPERTRLVLLSSCSSGLGDQKRNEAMGGLAQAFLAAGVPTVVASLWEIDDESTAGLMEKLHATHRMKNLAFGQSLRQAQISYLQSAPVRRRHPYFWATFIVTGNGLTT
jgi:CHAT domain-containing protein